jgi:hypothetical protein
VLQNNVHSFPGQSVARDEAKLRYGKREKGPGVVERRERLVVGQSNISGIDRLAEERYPLIWYNSGSMLTTWPSTFHVSPFPLWNILIRLDLYDHHASCIRFDLCSFISLSNRVDAVL